MNQHSTKKIAATDIDETMILVGESGGLSAVYEVQPSSLLPGMIHVFTEHGPLYLDSDIEYLILDKEET